MDALRALGEPNRFQIVELLRDGPRPVGDMVHRLGLRQPQVSKHLRVLSEAGLVYVRVDAQRRIYALRPTPFQELEVWLDRYRRIWEGNFQRLDALLVEMKNKGLKTKGKKRGRTKRWEKLPMTHALKVMARGEREVVMTRVLEASRELVFEAWTKPELLKRWLHGPEDWCLAVCEIDLRVRGAKLRPACGASGIDRTTRGLA